MNIQSYTIVHYGKDYLSYALKSVYHSVDQLNVFYTPNPSHGHQIDISPVETKEELVKAAFAYDPDNKVKWFDMSGMRHEGQQRDAALEFCQYNGADLVVVVDCDEIWHREQLELALSDAAEKSIRNHLVNMVHFWRSFNWVCRDDGWPVRIIDLRAPNRSVAYIPREMAQVYHFGYAIVEKVMGYKMKIHGHKNELRPNWTEDYWRLQNSPVFDCHPTNDNGFWYTEPFDKSELPDFMRDHPFYNLERIG